MLPASSSATAAHPAPLVAPASRPAAVTVAVPVAEIAVGPSVKSVGGAQLPHSLCLRSSHAACTDSVHVQSLPSHLQLRWLALRLAPCSLAARSACTAKGCQSCCPATRPPWRRTSRTWPDAFLAALPFRAELAARWGGKPLWVVAILLSLPTVDSDHASRAVRAGTTPSSAPTPPA